MADLEFPFRFHPLFRVPAALVGVTPGRAVVRLHDDRFEARFGPWVLSTRLDEVVGATVTGPYAWPKVIGPPHLSLADRGLTFATNPDLGVCIRFRRPVSGIDPFRLLRHPSLTVTVEDVAALAEVLDRPSHDPTRDHTAGGHVTAEDLVDEAADELEALTAAELRRRARDRGIPNTSRMSKADLVQELSPTDGNV